MTLLGFLLLLLIAGYSLGGLLVSIVVGVIGAFIGLWVARQLALPGLFVVIIEGEPFPVLWSIIGSFLFALVVGLLTRRRS